MHTYTVTTHRPGCYRTRREDSYAFGQARRAGREWEAEIRHRDTGDLIRFAGTWASKAQAMQELQHILNDVRYTRTEAGR